jgi:hypothetical protein
MTQPHPQSVFQEPGDKYDWDKYLEQLEFIELSESERKQASEAIQFLRGLFGETFLKKCFHNRHPFYYEFANSVPMARLRVIRFADSLQALENATGFDGIMTRLKRAKQPDEFKEASTVVETADRFQKTGLTIIFEPEVEITTTAGIKGFKNPDLKLINPKTGEEIFVEVSRLRESDEQITSANSFRTIWFLIHRIMDNSLVIEENTEENRQIHHHALPYANLLQHLEAEDLAEIVPKIEILAKRVDETNEFQELIIKDKIEVAISPIHDHSKAKQWAEKRSMKVLVKSPSIPLHETHRTRVKIGEKIRQLPHHAPGIIVIPTHETLLFFAYDVNRIIAEVKSEMMQYPQLLYVALTLQIGESPKEPVTVAVGDHLFTKRMREDFITELTILIKNPAFNLQVFKSTLKQITQAFIKH